jgi:hypothetical protein
MTLSSKSAPRLSSNVGPLGRSTPLAATLKAIEGGRTLTELGVAVLFPIICTSSAQISKISAACYLLFTDNKLQIFEVFLTHDWYFTRRLEVTVYATLCEKFTPHPKMIKKEEAYFALPQPTLTLRMKF